MDTYKNGADALFILLGGIMILAMHAGFAFLELGTVRRKNQVNALVKILIDFAVSTIAYFFVGYGIAYGIHFMGATSANDAAICGLNRARSAIPPDTIAGIAAANVSRKKKRTSA